MMWRLYIGTNTNEMLFGTLFQCLTLECKYFQKEQKMSSGFIVVIAIVSIYIWSILSLEIVKENNKNRFKLITLMLSGTLTTLFLMVSFFEYIQP